MSARAGEASVLASTSCSTTMVARRGARGRSRIGDRLDTDQPRTERVGATNRRRAVRSIRSRGRSETRPAQASGRPLRVEDRDAGRRGRARPAARASSAIEQSRAAAVGRAAPRHRVAARAGDPVSARSPATSAAAAKRCAARSGPGRARRFVGCAEARAFERTARALTRPPEPAPIAASARRRGTSVSDAVTSGDDHRIHGCYSEIDLELKLSAQARRRCWPRPTGRPSRFSSWRKPRFRSCSPCRSSAPRSWSPCCSAPILPNLLQGSLREIFTTIANALMSEPVALVAFVAAFAIVLVGGSVLMFLVKGGTVEVMLAARSTPPVRSSANRSRWRAPPAAQAFTSIVSSAAAGACSGAISCSASALMAVYAACPRRLSGVHSSTAYRPSSGDGVVIGWTFVRGAVGGRPGAVDHGGQSALSAAADRDSRRGLGVGEALRAVARFIRAEFLELGRRASSWCSPWSWRRHWRRRWRWSGVGLIAFVPLVGLLVVSAADCRADCSAAWSSSTSASRRWART